MQITTLFTPLLTLLISNFSNHPSHWMCCHTWSWCTMARMSCSLPHRQQRWTSSLEHTWASGSRFWDLYPSNTVSSKQASFQTAWGAREGRGVTKKAQSKKKPQTPVVHHLAFAFWKYGCLSNCFQMPSMAASTRSCRSLPKWMVKSTQNAVLNPANQMLIHWTETGFCLRKNGSPASRQKWGSPVFCLNWCFWCTKLSTERCHQPSLKCKTRIHFWGARKIHFLVWYYSNAFDRDRIILYFFQLWKFWEICLVSNEVGWLIDIGGTKRLMPIYQGEGANNFTLPMHFCLVLVKTPTLNDTFLWRISALKWFHPGEENLK